MMRPPPPEWELYHDPISHNPYWLKKDTLSVDWKGTPGVGDILFGMNAVHMLTNLAREKRDIPQMTMNVHWDHSRDYLYHFEDPETIIERADYLHNFYHDKDAVKVVHHFNSFDKELWSIRHRGFQRGVSKKVKEKDGPWAVLDGIPNWKFRKDLDTTAIPNKVCFWRPFSNAETPYGWKMAFKEKDWDRIIRILEDRGFEMVELTYRTPVREVLYHIRTCRFCIFYDGMWQYIAKNCMKPVITLGNSGITLVHSPQGVWFPKPNDPERDIWDYLSKMPRILEHLDSRLERYKTKLMKVIDED